MTQFIQMILSENKISLTIDSLEYQEYQVKFLLKLLQGNILVIHLHLFQM